VVSPFDAAARKMAALSAALPREVKGAVAKASARTATIARQRSLGPHSTATLAAMDHPYARRHGSPLLDPSVINVQSGDFLAGWEEAPVRAAGGRISGGIYNADPKADLLEGGTDVMFARPIAPATAQEARPEFERAVADALDRATEGE
jgi:hypothetical protein